MKFHVWLTAFESGDDILSGFYGNTRGIMFYSVPHRGSQCADINLPLLRQSVELTEVQKGKWFNLCLSTDDYVTVRD